MDKLISDDILPYEEFITMILNYGNVLRLISDNDNNLENSIATSYRLDNVSEVHITIYPDMNNYYPNLKHEVLKIQQLNFIVNFNNKLFLITKTITNSILEENCKTAYITLKNKTTMFREIQI